jgi:hypothetical protein
MSKAQSSKLKVKSSKLKAQYSKYKAELKHRWAVFQRWQRIPHRVKALSREEHDCPTCHTHYQGNYCPRCGQSAGVGRYSFKKAFLLFIDVWGMGNRGMYHTIRDLILRPGYMARDYLKGMQMAYFPPFKMLFLLTTLSVIVAHGLNIKLQVNDEEEAEVVKIFGDVDEEDNGAKQADSVAVLGKETAQTDSAKTPSATATAKAAAVAEAKGDSALKRGKDKVAKASESAKANKKNNESDVILENEGGLVAPVFANFTNDLFDKRKTFPNLFSLLELFFMSGFFYVFFRKMKTIDNIRFSEFFIANVYFSNMKTLVSIVFSFFCINNNTFATLLPIVMEVVAFKQLSGYGMKSTIMRMLEALALAVVVMILLIVLYFIILVVLSRSFG